MEAIFCEIRFGKNCYDVGQVCCIVKPLEFKCLDIEECLSTPTPPPSSNTDENDDTKIETNKVTICHKENASKFLTMTLSEKKKVLRLD